MKLLWNFVVKFARKWFAPCNRLIVRNIQPEWSWVDRDQLFFHACFTILVNFVENEMNGDQGLQKYIQDIEQMIQTETIDNQVAFLKKQAFEHRKMLELYRWYIQTDWQDPVKYTDEYRDLLDRMQIESVPVGENRFKMKINGVDEKILACERAMHTVREQQFEKIKIKNLVELAKIHNMLWN